MKTEEDEAFDDLARKQGMWGGGFQAKRAAAADKLQEPAQEQPVHMEIPEPEGWYCYDYDYPYEGHKYHTEEQIQKIVTAAVEAERKALAQPAQEPVALVIDGVLVKSELPEKYTGHLYTTPPKREWVGLMDDDEIPWDGVDAKSFARAIEQALKEKNNG